MKKEMTFKLNSMKHEFLSVLAQTKVVPVTLCHNKKFGRIFQFCRFGRFDINFGIELGQ